MLKMKLKTILSILIFVCITISYANGADVSFMKLDKNTVWRETIDFLIVNGFNIVTIDKDSGVILAEKELANNYYNGIEIGGKLTRLSRSAENKILTCERPDRTFADTWIRGKAKFTILSSKSYYSVIIRAVDGGGTQLTQKLHGISYWGPVQGVENPILSTCKSRGLIEQAHIYHLTGEVYTFLNSETDGDFIQRLDLGGPDELKAVAMEIHSAGGIDDISVYDKLEKILLEN